MVFPKCCLTSVYTARTGSLFLAILSSVAASRFVDGWCFSRGCFLWKAGAPRPRQHNQCSVWLRGEGRGGEGDGGCGLFYLISVSTRASVWCKRVGAPPPFATLCYLSSLFFFSHLDVCDSLILLLPPCAFCLSFPPYALWVCTHKALQPKQRNDDLLNANVLHQISSRSALATRSGVALICDHAAAPCKSRARFSS